jgi:hypothetical protein
MMRALRQVSIRVRLLPRLAAGPVLAAVVAVAAPAGITSAEVHLESVPASSRWPDAVEPGALRLACAGGEPELAAYFAREALALRPALVRRERGRVCHVLYRPTLEGFRAAPDDDAVSEILFDTDPLLYLATAERNPGDSFGAMREVLRHVARPLAVDVLIHRVHDARAYDEATARHFGGTPHRFTLVDRGVERTFWWVQDYVKAGRSPRGTRILVPRRIFESSVETAAEFAPLVATLLRQERVVRSRLSWEGGDLQFTRDPRDPRRLVLYCGGFAKPYWAEALTQAEYEHVLALEFGADRVVDLGGVFPHVDYFAAFLPSARIALVSEPVAGDLEVARAAAEALAARFGGNPPAALSALREALASARPELGPARAALERARSERATWRLVVDRSLPERMRALVARACPSGEGCLSPAGQLRLLAADRATFGAWVEATQAARDEPAVIAAHLDLVGGQLEPVPDELKRRTQAKIGELEALGFRVVRVPSFRVDSWGPRGWPGVSYVNALVLDRTVFVPRFGLGAVEERVYRAIGAQLPAGYSLVPVDAQQVLIRNGGLHCLAGLVR